MTGIPAVADVWRDYEIPSAPASGAHWSAKSEIRASLMDMDNRIASAVATTSLVYGTRAALFSNLTLADGSRAEERGDSTSGHNGVYSKSGPTWTGTWTRISRLPDDDAQNLPRDFVEAKLLDWEARAASCARVVEDCRRRFLL